MDLQISKGAEEGSEGPWVGREIEWMKGGRLEVARIVAYDCMLCRRKVRPIWELDET
jgi:hypothetical protein